MFRAPVHLEVDLGGDPGRQRARHPGAQEPRRAPEALQGALLFGFGRLAGERNEDFRVGEIGAGVHPGHRDQPDPGVAHLATQRFGDDLADHLPDLFRPATRRRPTGRLSGPLVGP